MRSEGGRGGDTSSQGILEYWMLVARIVDQADNETRRNQKKRNISKAITE